MMTWLDRLSLSVGRFLDRTLLEERADPSPGFNLYAPDYYRDKPRWPDANIGTYRKSFASQVAVYRCVMARAGGVSSATARIYQETNGDRTELPKHPMRLLISRPNPLMSEAEFWVMTQTLMDATGFAAIQKERAPAGNVIGLWHLRSDWLQEIKRNQKPSDWKYNVPGRNEPFILKAEDVIIVAGGPSTDLGVTGMSPIAVALREVGIDSSLTDFLKIFIDGGGMPRQALVTDHAIRDQAVVDEITGRFQQAYAGFRNWTKIALLSDGMKVQNIGSNIEELAYPQLRALTETHIASVFGVPPIIAGIQAGLDASTYSNYGQARKAFFEETVTALWARLDGAFTRGLLPDFTDDPSISLEFDTSDVPALQEDKTTLWTRTGEMLARGGLTLNQAQNALGLPGFGPEGDVLYLSISVQPTRPEDLSFLADTVTEPPQPVPAALQAGGKGDEESQGEAGESGAAASAAESGDRALVFSELERQRSVVDGDTASTHITSSNGHRAVSSGTVEAVRILTLPLETRARIVTTNRRAVSRLTAKFTPRLRAMYRRQGKIVAAAVAKRFDEGIETRDLTDIVWDELEVETLRELNGLYEAAGRMAFTGAASALSVDIDWSLSNPKIRQTMIQLARRVTGINATTRSDVARIVVDGIEAGLSTPQISEALKGLFEETYRGRAMAIARTESQVSYNLATADAYRESGIVMAMTLHDNPNHVDDYGASDGLSCAERNGVITDVDAVQQHIYAEHPNGSLAVSPLLVRPLGTE